MQSHRLRRRILGFSVICAGFVLFWVTLLLLNLGINQRRSPRGTFFAQGTVIFTTGDPGGIYAMDLPTRRVKQLRIEGMSDYKVVQSLSGPNRGHLVLNSLDGSYYLSLDKSGVFKARNFDVDQASLSPDGCVHRQSPAARRS